MGFTGNLFHELKFESESDLIGPAGLLEETVEISFSSPEPSAIPVKGNSGHDRQIQNAGISRTSGTGCGFENSIAARFQTFQIFNLDHLHPFQAGIDPGDKNPFSFSPGFFQKGTGLHLETQSDIGKYGTGFLVPAVN